MRVEMFSAFLGSLASLVFLIAVGYGCRKLRLLDDKLNAGLTALLVKVTLPCTVFQSLMRPFSRQLLGESALTFVLSAGVFLCGGLAGAALAKLMKAAPGERRVWQFALIFANVGYMGFPVSQAVFGDEGLIYTSMANAAFNLLAFTVGIRLFNPAGGAAPEGSAKSESGAITAGEPRAEGKPGKINSFRMIISSPALIATLAGFILFVTGLRLPQPVHTGMSMLGGMTTPVSMMLVGSILAKNRLRSLFTDLRTVPVIVFRLAVIPLAAFFILRLIVGNPTMLGVIIALSAMPVASLTVIFAEQYKGDTALASRLVALSTLCCVVTVPLISLLLF